MSTPTHQPEVTFVPIIEQPGWFIPSVGKTNRPRSCIICRKKKVSCSGASITIFCERCKQEKEECLYGFTETEMEKFKSTRQKLGIEEARKALKLKSWAQVQELLSLQGLREDWLVEHLNRTGLKENVEIDTSDLPSYDLISSMVKVFFDKDCNTGLPCINQTLLDMSWLKEPGLLLAIGLNVLTQIPPLLGKQRERHVMIGDLTLHVRRHLADVLMTKVQLIFDRQIVPEWTTICMGYLLFTSVGYRGVTDLSHLTSKLNQVYSQFVQKGEKALEWNSNLTPEKWMIFECVRRSCWGFAEGSLFASLLHGKVYHTLPWHIMRRLPLFARDDVFLDMTTTGDLSRIREVYMKKQDWLTLQTIGWMTQTRDNPDRLQHLKRNFGDLREFGAMNFFVTSAVICCRACRGRLTFWNDTMTDLQDLGEMLPGDVSMEEFLSPDHWEALLDDVFNHLPEEVLLADGQGRGDLLIELSTKYWGKQWSTRLFQCLALLHEARMGCIVRKGDLDDGNVDLNEFLVDMFTRKLNDEALTRLLNEAMIISRFYGSLLQAKPDLEGMMSSALPMALRMGYINLAIARRLKALGKSQDLVDMAESDSKVILQAVDVVGRRAEWLGRQYQSFKILVESGDEPRLSDVDGSWGGLGFLRSIRSRT